MGEGEDQRNPVGEREDHRSTVLGKEDHRDQIIKREDHGVIVGKCSSAPPVSSWSRDTAQAVGPLGET